MLCTNHLRCAPLTCAVHHGAQRGPDPNIFCTDVHFGGAQCRFVLTRWCTRQFCMFVISSDREAQYDGVSMEPCISSGSLYNVTSAKTFLWHAMRPFQAILIEWVQTSQVTWIWLWATTTCGLSTTTRELTSNLMGLSNITSASHRHHYVRNWIILMWHHSFIRCSTDCQLTVELAYWHLVTVSNLDTDKM